MSIPAMTAASVSFMVIFGRSTYWKVHSSGKKPAAAFHGDDAHPDTAQPFLTLTDTGKPMPLVESNRPSVGEFHIESDPQHARVEIHSPAEEQRTNASALVPGNDVQA